MPKSGQPLSVDVGFLPFRWLSLPQVGRCQSWAAIYATGSSLIVVADDSLTVFAAGAGAAGIVVAVVPVVPVVVVVVVAAADNAAAASRLVDNAAPVAGIDDESIRLVAESVFAQDAMGEGNALLGLPF